MKQKPAYLEDFPACFAEKPACFGMKSGRKMGD